MGGHNALFFLGGGGYYGAYKIKIANSGPPQRLQIHYEALPADRIEYEMANFLNFINKSSDNPYIKSAIAHLWFAIVHLMMTAMDAGKGFGAFLFV
jgi:hypothetical protein